MNNPLAKVARITNSVHVLAQSGLLGPYRPDQIAAWSGPPAATGCRRPAPTPCRLPGPGTEWQSWTSGGPDVRPRWSNGPAPSPPHLADRGISEGSRSGSCAATIVASSSHRRPGQGGRRCPFPQHRFRGSATGRRARARRRRRPDPRPGVRWVDRGRRRPGAPHPGLARQRATDTATARRWTSSIDRTAPSGSAPTRAPGPPDHPDLGNDRCPQGGQSGRPDHHGAAGRAALQDPHAHGDTTLVAAPMFHAWGLGHLALGMLFGSTLVLRRRFDPRRRSS